MRGIPAIEVRRFKRAWLKMTASSKMRDLAQRLLAYEAGEGETSEPMESATLRVYEKLRQGLGEFAGIAGFQSLASRALALARTEAPGLSTARISADGALQGLGQGLDEFESSIEIDRDRAAAKLAGEGGIILISRLLGLLLMFLGEALTLSLLRVTWPAAALDDCSSENGRKA
jgi:hypothetical protein